MYDMDGIAVHNLDPVQSAPHRPESPEGVSKVHDLLRRAADRKQQQAEDPSRFHEPWFEPNPMAMAEQPEDRHLMNLFIEESTPRLRQGRRSQIRKLLSLITGRETEQVSWQDVLDFPWHQFSPDDARGLHHTICVAYPNRNSRGLYIATMRSIMRRCRDAKLISLSRLVEITDELPTPRGRRVAQRRRRLKSHEINALMAVCQRDANVARAARDGAMIAVFMTTGIRVCELVGLDLAHWNRQNQTLLLIDTKNGGDHEVPVDPRTERYLDAWLRHRGEAPGPLFVSLRGRQAKESVMRRMTNASVLGRVQRLAGHAGIGHMATHDFRRTVASSLLRTTDAALVGRLLNHKNLASTLTYDLATEDEQRNAICTLPLPEIAAEDGVA